MKKFAPILSAVIAINLLSSCMSLDAKSFKIADKSCTEIAAAPVSGSETSVLLIAPTSNFTSSAAILSAARSGLVSQFNGKTVLKTYVAAQDSKVASSVTVDLSNTISTDAKEKKVTQAIGLTALAVGCYLDSVSLGQELDLLTSLKSAGDAMAGNLGPKNIFVFSNGLQTAGDLRLQESFNARTEDIISTLSDAEALPDLSGVSVYIFGLGQVSGEQPVFSGKSLNKLEEIWAAIINASGGTLHISGSIDLKNGNPEGPKISIVSPLYVQPVVVNCSAVLTDENLSFKSDSAEFMSPEKAKETFMALQSQFGSNNCEGRISVKGFTTNFGSEEQQKNVARDRASAVAGELANLLPNFEIESLGIGYDGSGELAPSNRRVEVSIQ